MICVANWYLLLCETQMRLYSHIDAAVSITEHARRSIVTKGQTHRIRERDVVAETMDSRRVRPGCNLDDMDVDYSLRQARFTVYLSLSLGNSTCPKRKSAATGSQDKQVTNHDIHWQSEAAATAIAKGSTSTACLLRYQCRVALRIAAFWHLMFALHRIPLNRTVGALRRRLFALPQVDDRLQAGLAGHAGSHLPPEFAASRISH